MNRDELFLEDPPRKVEERPALNEDQAKAIEAILQWLNDGDTPYYILSGAAGTGKTFALQELLTHIDGEVILTAPTNKATKVLREMLTTEDYSPICRTIYSLLGLKLEPSGEVKQLKSPENSVDLKQVSLVVVDEASMVNRQLFEEIEKAARSYGTRFLFLGDPNQLPPVGEMESMVWVVTDNKSELRQVMRFDNQILKLAERIKAQVNHPAPSIQLAADNDCIEGVWKESPNQFRQIIIRAARLGDFSDRSAVVKAIAWRNATVAELNSLIRRQIFDNSDEARWLVGDRIILTAPATDFTGELIGCTDDEGTVERVEILPHPMYQSLQCYNLSVMTDENKRIALWILHPEAEFEYRFMATNLSNEARLFPKKWRDYWKFADSFHKAQHGYAITAHRAQGSTYNTCFVAWNDILINRNRGEAFRCLYVACTRPRKRLILGSW